MSDFLDALANIATPEMILWIIAGFLIGVLAGATPGIGPELGILLLLPFTLGMDPGTALVFLVCVYVGGDYGGSIPAILLNTPGTASNAATVLDGYPMAQKNKAVTALSISGTAGAIGSVLSGVLILCFVPLLGIVILWFGTPEYFMMAVLGLCTIAVVSTGGVLKGVIVATLGAVLATVGSNAIIPDRRFTLGFSELSDGLALVPAFVGLFAIAEMVKISVRRSGDANVSANAISAGSRIEGARYVLRNWFQSVKSTLIGLWVGIMPGQGGAVANYLAYMEAKTSSKNPEDFGKGAPGGVLAPEVSNNAIVPGTLVPTLSFGIPGSASSAILLGALLLHGLRPGPDMFSTELSLTYTIFLAIPIAGVVLFVFSMGFARQLGKIPNVSPGILAPTIISLALIGAYAVERNYFHVWQAVVFGGLALILGRFGYPVVPFVLGFILGPIAELNLSRSLLIGDGSFMIFLERPISAVLVIVSLLILIVPPWRQSRKNKHTELKTSKELHS